MRLEFIPWAVNIEVQLRDDDDRVVDRFYVRNEEILINTPGVDARFLANLLEDTLGPPTIGGNLGSFHPYWAERKVRRGK